MKNLTWQNPEQLFVAQELINKVKSKCCGIKANIFQEKLKDSIHTYIIQLYLTIIQLITKLNTYNKPTCSLHVSYTNFDSFIQLIHFRIQLIQRCISLITAPYTAIL